MATGSLGSSRCHLFCLVLPVSRRARVIRLSRSHLRIRATSQMEKNRSLVTSSSTSHGLDSQGGHRARRVALPLEHSADEVIYVFRPSWLTRALQTHRQKSALHRVD